MMGSKLDQMMGMKVMHGVHSVIIAPLDETSIQQKPN